MTAFVKGVVPLLADVGPWGPLLFVALYVVSAVTMAPSFLITLAAGAIYGVWGGAAVVFTGAAAGASVSFVISRWLADTRLFRALDRDPRAQIVRRAVTGGGVRAQCLLRLSPLVPFGLLNYTLGLSRVPFRDYALGLLGMIPVTLAYTYSGRVIGDVARIAAGVAPPRGPLYWVVLAGGLAATVGATVLLTRAARSALSSERPAR